jgi:hypothetical protein
MGKNLVEWVCLGCSEISCKSQVVKGCLPCNCLKWDDHGTLSLLEVEARIPKWDSHGTLSLLEVEARIPKWDSHDTLKWIYAGTPKWIRNSPARAANSQNSIPPFCVYCQRVVDLTCNGGTCSMPNRFIPRNIGIKKRRCNLKNKVASSAR